MLLKNKKQENIAKSLNLTCTGEQSLQYGLEVSLLVDSVCYHDLGIVRLVLADRGGKLFGGARHSQVHITGCRRAVAVESVPGAVGGPVTNSILFCWHFTINNRCQISAFSTNAQSRFASVVVNGVLGPPRLARHT